MQLTQKETELLKDLAGQEQLCVEKYRKHAADAKDPGLSGLLSYIGGIEAGHLKAVKETKNGGVPTLGSASPAPAIGEAANTDAEAKKCDAFICSDLLATEKHASHLYDTCIFEFGQPEYRKTLNRIQTEEQEHGKLIYDYMKKNGMYS